MATNHMHNLTTLIKRLEAATSRLEDMAVGLDGNDNQAPQGTPPAGTLAAAPTPEPAPVAPAPTAAPAADPLPAVIEDFDALINKEVKTFLEIGEKIGGLVAEQSKAVLQAFEAERTYLYVSTKAKKPDPQPVELMTQLHVSCDTMNNLKEANRPSPLFNHLSAVSEGAMAMGWFFESKPAEFVAEILGGAQFYGNRVLKEYKEKDPNHVEYINAYYSIFKSLVAYIKEHYPKGLTWNKDGIDAMEALKQIESGSSPASASPSNPPSLSLPPPPPPPPPPMDMLPPPPAPSSGGGDMTAVFQQLNQGAGITSSLRKVDKSEMTHKNPNLRAGSTVTDRPSSQGSAGSRGKSPIPSKKPKPESMRAKKPPRKELEGNKWYIENFDNPGDIIEIPAHLSHSILISRCHKTIIKVSNKANAISIDNCNNLSIIIDSLVSSVDVIKSPKFALQVDGVLPTVLLDQVDGATIYLGQESLATEVFSSKCSNINVMLPPKEGSDEDTKECPVPEQLKTVVKNGQLVSEIVEHAG